MTYRGVRLKFDTSHIPSTRYWLMSRQQRLNCILQSFHKTYFERAIFQTLLHREIEYRQSFVGHRADTVNQYSGPIAAVCQTEFVQNVGAEPIKHGNSVVARSDAVVDLPADVAGDRGAI